MHLVDDVVGGVFEGQHSLAVAAGCPCPSPSPRVSFDQDRLGGGACGTDAVDTGLVEGDDELLVHVMKLVVGVENNLWICGKVAGQILPECLEASNVGNDCTHITTVVVRINDGVGALRFGDIIDGLIEVLSAQRRWP